MNDERGDGPRGTGPRGTGQRGTGQRGTGQRGTGPRGTGPRGTGASTGQEERVSLRVAVLATLAAVGLGAGADLARDAGGWEYPSWPEMLAATLWMIGVGAIAVVGFRLVDRRTPTLADLGLGLSDVPADERAARWRAARRWIAISVVALFVLGAVVGHASGRSADADDLDSIGAGLLVATVLVRWPISVVAQQVLFFGWLQPRLGKHGLLIAACLYAASHLWDPRQALVVIPLGFIFAIERWASGRTVVGIATHYGINVVLFVLALAGST